MRGKFDTDATALNERISANTQYAAVTLEDWIINKLHLNEGMKVLDLGCGTGKQLLALRGRASLLGLDCSQTAVDEAKAKGFEAICASFDDPIPGQYDLILSTYAIYYAKDMLGVIHRLKENLLPGGRVFLVGPGEGSNKEFADYMELPWKIPDFVSVSDLRYNHVQVDRLYNSVTFPTKDALLAWWSNHNSFDESKVASLDDLQYPFTMSKNVLGVMLYD